MSEYSDSGILRLPSLAIGCMSLPERYAETEKILHSAIDSEITFFDTADLYQMGKNEENIGRAFGARRSKLFLATKVGNQWNPDGKSWSWNPRKGYILEAVDQSLKRLRTDYIDLYQLHGGTLDDPWEEVLEAFHFLKNQGKIRAFGISSIRPNVIRKVLDMSDPATIMMQYSPLDRRPEETVFPMLEQTKTRVLVRGSLAKGILIDKEVTGFLDFSKAQVSGIKSAIRLDDYAAEAVLIRFGLVEKAVSSLVVGVSSVEQVEKLRKSYEESLSLPDDLIRGIKEKLPKNFYQDHR